MTGVLNMLLAAGPAVHVDGQTINDSLNTSATIEFNADGNVYQTTTGSGRAQIDSALDWIRPASAASGSYEIRATVNSGTVSSGSATGSWLALSTTRSWSTTTSVNLTIEIRLGSNVLDSGTYSLSAT